MSCPYSTAERRRDALLDANSPATDGSREPSLSRFPSSSSIRRCREPLKLPMPRATRAPPECRRRSISPPSFSPRIRSRYLILYPSPKVKLISSGFSSPFEVGSVIKNRFVALISDSNSSITVTYSSVAYLCFDCEFDSASTAQLVC
ncbi:uncharacterized protein LOC121967400 isoform X2 [Zingiber officinale]|uniref:uncharacterized protein LOC121967400 isoform X2 n=2 Tax=Zingiber officinale TaxID=94328 RepID=UPI001C4D6808|nr:uncharacterized protein LOC121967400 isoform X2 [Zingiber officinale]